MTYTLRQNPFDLPGLNDTHNSTAGQANQHHPACRKATIDDGMNPELVMNADFDGILGMPIIKRPNEFIIPANIIPFGKRNRDVDPTLAVGFYEMDTEFANVLIEPERFIDEFRHRPLISPDCSLYRDAPLAVQIANIYKSRAIGAYYQSHGVYVIPQIRWGNSLTYSTEALSERIAFLGVEKHSIVAISTYGCIRTENDKLEFTAGLDAMMKALEPKVVLVYGSMPDQIFNPYKHNADFKHYEDWTSRMRSVK